MLSVSILRQQGQKEVLISREEGEKVVAIAGRKGEDIVRIVYDHCHFNRALVLILTS